MLASPVVFIYDFTDDIIAFVLYIGDISVIYIALFWLSPEIRFGYLNSPSRAKQSN